MMTDKIKTFIAAHRLLRPEGLQLVAVSGGADSVCLLLVLRQLGYRVEAVHCNFHLRGQESQRDEKFVQDLCTRLAIPLHTCHFDTLAYARLHHVSIEMAARQLRYAYFHQLRADLQADAICVAHHQDDSVETVLLNLVRGTGIEGLTGIKPRNGHVVRPLLCVGRSEIEQWLQRQHQDYVTDSSNLVADVQRNRLRLDVVPRLEQLLPGAKAGISRTAQWVAEAVKVYRSTIDDALRRLVVDDGVSIDALAALPWGESLLHEWLSPLGFHAAATADVHRHVAAAAAGGPPLQGGRRWLSATHQLVVHQGRLVVAPLPVDMPTLVIPEPGTYRYADTLPAVTLRLHEGAVIERRPTAACLDADRVDFPLTLRPVAPADRFRPYGMKGQKLVSDFMTDAKLSLIDKQQQTVLCDARGAVVWLVARRPDARFCVNPATRRTLVITLS